MRLAVACLPFVVACLNVDSNADPGPTTGSPFEVVTQGLGHDIALRVDNQNNVHAAFIVGSRVVYAHHAAAFPGFIVEDVAHGDDLQGTGLALGPQGQVAIVYAHGTQIELARRVGEQWTSEPVGDTGAAQPDPKLHPAPAIAVDGVGRTYIAYSAATSHGSELHYFVREHGEPVKTGVIDVSPAYADGGGGAQLAGVASPHFALDTSGSAHLCFVQAREQSGSPASDLLYAPWTGTRWDVQLADRGGRVGADCGIVIDGDGRPHISHMDWNTFDVCHTYLLGTRWNSEVVQAAGEVGRFSSLSLDPKGMLEIAYLDATREAIVHAVGSAGAWETEHVMYEGAYAGGGLGFAVDSAGAEHYIATRTANDRFDVVYFTR